MDDYILLIEDDDDHAELAEFYIQEASNGLGIVRLSDGKQAMDFVDETDSQDKKTPWLILLDLKLPKYDGHEILEKIKSCRKLLASPVVVFTTSNSHHDIEKAFNGGVNSYLVKPTDPDMYEQSIRSIINYWQLDQHRLSHQSKEDHE